MARAQIGIPAVLDAAQAVIDEHVTTVECFGRCVKCGEAWPCEARGRAGVTFYEAERLPLRASAVSTEAHGVRWSPVDWFGSGRITVAARGAAKSGGWRLRAATA